jgi:RNA polymerase sigma factor (TIGR02999 family)
MSQVSLLIEAAQRGETQAVHALLPIVYGELRKLASVRLQSEGAGQTLQPTALVHEVYLRLIGPANGESPLFANQRHFFAAAAESMRRILIERARAKNAEKRGGKKTRVDVDFNLIAALDDQRVDDLFALDESLQELALHDPQGAELIKLRFFAGLTHQQAAESLGLTRREADRVWALAKAWLFRSFHQTATRTTP